MYQTSTAADTLEPALYRLYRDFFDKAEKKRRWSLRDDIPWDQTNKNLAPAVASVVESFCAVELFLPDYLGQAMKLFRSSRARTWFYANWGYEESKHSIALGDWLLRSGHRSESQLAEFQAQVFQHRWDLPLDSPVGMTAYAMVQELATGLNYRNLRRKVNELGGDPALDKLLGFVSVDEQAHHRFFMDTLRLFLAEDREETLRQLHRVLHTFSMPALHMLADSERRQREVRDLQIFDEGIYFREVYEPVLAALGVTRPELRKHA
jgi:acyl-[acyl-carrier-protein] desaturase